MTQIGNHDDAYLSTPLEQKLAWFQNAAGLSAVEPASQFMAGAAALYTDSDSQVRATMRGLGADWTGDAATNAGATLQRAADWSQGAGARNSAGGETVEGYGKSFESLRGQVHWDDPWAWGWNDTASAAASVATLDPAIFLGNLTTDYFTTAQQNRTNDASAVAALRAHEQQTRTAVDSFPTLAPAGIDPSSADTGVSPDGPRPGDLPASPVAPAGAGTSTGGGGLPGALGGGVAAALGTAAGSASRAGGGNGLANPAGGEVGAAAGSIGGVTSAAGPIGASSVAVGPVGSQGAGATSGGAAAVQPGLGAVGAGGLGAGGPGTGGLGTAGPGAAGAGPLGAGRLGAGGSATRAGLPGGLGGAAGEAARGAGTGIPGTGPPRGSTDGPVGGSIGRVGLPGGQAAGLRAVDPPGRTSPLLGSEMSDGTGGWRDAVSRGPSESGPISRGPASGTEFAARLPSGAPETPPSVGVRGGAAGAGMPFLGGMGAGAGARSTEHRPTYWIRSSDPFDVPLPPHGDGLLQGSDE